MGDLTCFFFSETVRTLKVFNRLKNGNSGSRLTSSALINWWPSRNGHLFWCTSAYSWKRLKQIDDIADGNHMFRVALLELQKQQVDNRSSGDESTQHKPALNQCIVMSPVHHYVTPIRVYCGGNGATKWTPSGLNQESKTDWTQHTQGENKIHDQLSVRRYHRPFSH